MVEIECLLTEGWTLVDASQGRVRQLVDTSVQCALWPPSVAHELTHLAVGYFWTDRVTGYDVHPLRPNYIELDIRDSTPGWAVAIIATAPVLVGVAFAAAVLVLLAVGGGDFPPTTDAPGRWLLLAAWWFVYTSPSRDDIDALRGGHESASP